MPQLDDLRIATLSGDPTAQIESMTRQINEAFRNISNEDITTVKRGDDGKIRLVQGKLPYENGYGTLYYDENEIPSIIIGILPDGTTGIVVAKSGENVIDAFS